MTKRVLTLAIRNLLSITCKSNLAFFGTPIKVFCLGAEVLRDLSKYLRVDYPMILRTRVVVAGMVDQAELICQFVDFDHT